MQIHEVSADRALRRIDMTPLEASFTQNFKILVKMIEAYGFKLRIVGGAVRDLLLGMAPRDIDLATDAVPDAIMFILTKHSIPYVTKGIPHGTVKVKFDDEEEYEITSIGYTVEDDCCPQSIKIHSSDSWKADAERRDFTIDQMSLSMTGHLYDYTNGIDDLRNQHVRFLGNAAERIKKDPILIMRFFKLLAKFKDPKFDADVLPVIKANMRLVRKIKPERMTLELGNITGSPNGERVLKMMNNLGFADAMKEIKEDRMILEALATLRPAIKVYLRNVEPKIFIGNAGETHGYVYNTIPDDIGMISAEPESGFFDTSDGMFLSRGEALRRYGTGESQHLRRLQAAQSADMAA